MANEIFNPKSILDTYLQRVSAQLTTNFSPREVQISVSVLQDFIQSLESNGLYMVHVDVQLEPEQFVPTPPKAPSPEEQVAMQQSLERTKRIQLQEAALKAQYEAKLKELEGQDEYLETEKFIDEEPPKVNKMPSFVDKVRAYKPVSESRGAE